MDASPLFLIHCSIYNRDIIIDYLIKKLDLRDETTFIFDGWKGG